MNDPKVAIVIVVWNGLNDTIECLDSLREDSYPNKEIVIVDNGSTDGSAEAIRERFPEVTVIATGKNLGFTGGNNAGIRYAIDHGADYVYLLNNDTTVEPDATEQLVRAAQANSGYGLVAPVMHYYDAPRDLWFAGSSLDLDRGIALHDNTKPPTREQAPFEVPWVTGCAMMIPAPLLDRMEGFDDRFYLTWEDVDLSIRIRNSGKALAAVPASRIYHKGAMSADKLHESKFYFAVRNKLLLVSKHNSGFKYAWSAGYIVTTSIWRCLRAFRSERAEFPRYVRSVYLGVRDHLSGQYGPYRGMARQ